MLKLEYDIFRRILNDLSSETTVASSLAVPKIEEESNSSQTSQESQDATEAGTASAAAIIQQYPASSIVKGEWKICNKLDGV